MIEHFGKQNFILIMRKNNNMIAQNGKLYIKFDHFENPMTVLNIDPI